MPDPQIDHALATDFSVASNTPHVVVYRFWIKRPSDADWVQIGEGRTSDAVSDHFIVAPPLPAGSEFGYWIGIGGPLNSSWRVTLTVAQGGRPVPSGVWEESGTITTPALKGLGSDQRNGTVTL